jgi:dTDP-4-amino-4,6-dideoxy-D-galactose acyltransferase
MSASFGVEPLAWDTQFWGVIAARATAEQVTDLAHVEELCLRLGVDWVSLLVPAANVDLINEAVRDGYDIVDFRHTMRKPLVGPFLADETDLAEPDDVDAMAKIAVTAFGRSRFFVDRHLDDDTCAAFYDTWVRNSLHGSMADAAVVSRYRKRVDGFVTVKVRPDGVGVLPLVAIRGDRRGQGIGRRLVGDALGWLGERGAETAEVVTQSSNTTAIKLYESAGFATVDISAWLHRWFGPVAPVS